MDHYYFRLPIDLKLPWVTLPWMEIPLGASPVGGIDKYFFCKWLVWMEKENTLGLGKTSSLKLVNDQDPTAELGLKNILKRMKMILCLTKSLTT